MPIKSMQQTVKDWITTILPSRDPTKTCIKLVTEAAELLDSVANQASPRSAAGEEIADVFILLIDVADQMGVDLEAEFARKMEINKNRTWRVGNGSLHHT